jgi:hypothetical protein
MNIMNAIKAGILTCTTKAELERLEEQHARLEEEIKGASAKADKIVTLLLRARGRYEALVSGLGELSNRHVAQAREQVEIWWERFAWCQCPGLSGSRDDGPIRGPGKTRGWRQAKYRWLREKDLNLRPLGYEMVNDICTNALIFRLVSRFNETFQLLRLVYNIYCSYGFLRFALWFSTFLAQCFEGAACVSQAF